MRTSARQRSSLQSRKQSQNSSDVGGKENKQVMTTELTHLELLTSVDERVQQLSHWSMERTDWEPVRQEKQIVRQLVQRLEPMQARVETPLVVAAFGGTGVGKSVLASDNDNAHRRCSSAHKSHRTRFTEAIPQDAKPWNRGQHGRTGKMGLGTTGRPY